MLGNRGFIHKRTVIQVGIVLVLICISSLYFGIKHKDCAEAQSCLPVRPDFYKSDEGGYVPPGDCSASEVEVDIFAPGEGPTWVALKGFELEYKGCPTCGNEIHDVDSIGAGDTGDCCPPTEKDRVRYTLHTCLDDNDGDDPYHWRVINSILRWR